MPVYRRFVNNLRTKKTGNPESSRLLKQSSVVAACTLVSRLLGFVRDIIFATLFGATASFDAFLCAFKIPNFFRRLFGEGAFSQAFVPVLVNLSKEHDEETVRRFISRIFSNLSIILLFLIAIVECVSPLVVLVFAPGFAHHLERYHLATNLLRIMFPYMLLISLTALCGAILNTHKRFAVPAFAPVLLNVAFIVVALSLSSHVSQPIYLLAAAVLVGGVLQLALQIPVLIRLKLFPRFDLNWRDPGVTRVLKLMVPALFGVSVAQISLLVDNFFASFLRLGSLSWLYYSDRLTYLPLGVIGVAIATVVLPELSRQSNQHAKQYSRTLDWALRSALLVGVPAALSLIVLAGPMLATFFLRGNFSVFDVIMTEHSLWAFAFGLPAFMLIKILASAFYARENVKTPVKIAAIALLVNIVGNVVLIHIIHQYKHAGLALSTSIAAYVNATFLLVILIRKKIFVPSHDWLKYALRLLGSSILMVAAVFFSSASMHVWVVASLSYKVWHLFFLITLGVVVYFLCMLVFGWRWRAGEAD
jgi:putative peptidoglycan lipid II flippase